MSDNAMDDLFDQAETASDGEDRWDFEENPEVRGILVGVGTGPDMGYGKFHILRVKEIESEKTWNIAVFGTVFKNRTEELAPKIGFPIGIRYEGMKSNKDGSREYKSWLVVSPESDHAYWQQQVMGLTQGGGTNFTQGVVEGDGRTIDTDPGDFF